MLTPADQQQIQQMIQQNLKQGSFGNKPTTFHVHNNHDGSPYIASQPNHPRIYFGLVNADGTPGKPFPNGWTSSESGSSGNAIFTVTHNLNSLNYVPMVTEKYIIGSSIDDVTFIYGSPTANSFQVSTKSALLISFFFAVIIP